MLTLITPENREYSKPGGAAVCRPDTGNGKSGLRMLTNIKRITEYMLDSITAMGFDIEVVFSRRSRSRYLYVRLSQDRCITVRISDHAPGRNCGYRFDIHTDMQRKGSMTYLDCIEALTEFEGITMDINRVILVGRLTRDAELKYTANGQAVCKLSIAVNRRKKSGDQWADEVHFFDAVLWGKQAEALSRYLVKGKQVGVEGELRQERWEQDGQNRSKVEIAASNVQLLGGGNGSGNSGGSSSPDRNGFNDEVPF